MNNYSQQIPDPHDPRLQLTRQLEIGVIVFVAVYVPGVFFSLWRAAEFGFNIGTAVQILSAVSVVALWALRSRLRYGTVVVLGIGCVFLFGFAGLITWGLAGQGLLTILFAVYLGTLVGSFRQAVYVALASFLAVSAIGLAFVMNWLPVNFSVAEYMKSPAAWWIALATIGGLMAIMMAMVVRLKESWLQVMQEVRSSEERLRLAWDTTPDYVSISRLKDGLMVDVNRGFTELMGYSREDVVGRSSVDFQLWVDPSDRSKLVDALSKHGRVSEFETKFRRKDGETRSVAISAGLMTSLGESYIFAIVKDIEEAKRAEQALRESEQKYRLLAENVTDVIFTTDLDLQPTFVSPSIERMHGWTPSEALALHVSDLLPPGDLEMAFQKLQDELAVLNTPGYDPDRPIAVEVRQYRKDGSIFWAEVLAHLLRDAEGDPVGVIGVTRDITARKKTEEAIRSIVEGVSGETGDRFFESSVIHFANILEADYTFIGEVSPGDHATSVKTLAFSARGELRENFEYDLAGAPCEEVANKRICSYPRGVAGLFPRDELLQEMDIEAYVGVCLYDSRNEPVGIMAAMYRQPLEDVEFAEAVLRIFASRAAAEIERRKSSENLQRLFIAVEHAGETIMITDPKARILYVNSAFEKTTGYSKEEALGTTPHLVSSGKHGTQFLEDLWSALRRGEVWRGRSTSKRKDGTLFEETVTISPIRDDSAEIVSLVMVGRDVTAETMLQKQLEQAQKMEAVGTLAGGIAHDFNNLLQVMLGYTDLMLSSHGPVDPDRTMVMTLRRAVKDGADLVSRILTFSRKGESKIRPIDLNAEICRVAALLRRTLPKMIRVDMILSDGLRVIDADPAQIEQALVNLGINAQHAMPEGGQLLIETRNVSLTDDYSSTHLGAEPGKYVLLKVSDTGAGMAPEVLDRIFEPFFTTKKDGQGTGLGLSMVHGIVSQHRGHISCYSEPGAGTSFSIYLPASAGGLAPDPTLTREMPTFGTETILLVDDDDRVRLMGGRMIETGGYKVVTAQSGEEAVETYARLREEIALVVLDVMMPGMGGRRCLEKLLETDPDAKVLLASGYSESRITQTDQWGGAKGFVNKPYDLKEILTAIRKTLDEA